MGFVGCSAEMQGCFGDLWHFDSKQYIGVEEMAFLHGHALLLQALETVNENIYARLTLQQCEVKQTSIYCSNINICHHLTDKSTQILVVFILAKISL